MMEEWGSHFLFLVFLLVVLLVVRKSFRIPNGKKVIGFNIVLIDQTCRVPVYCNAWTTSELLPK